MLCVNGPAIGGKQHINIDSHVNQSLISSLSRSLSLSLKLTDFNALFVIIIASSLPSYHTHTHNDEIINHFNLGTESRHHRTANVDMEEW
jgi:hypothetical protein